MQTRKELYDSLNYTPGNEWIYPNTKLSDNSKINDKI